MNGIIQKIRVIGGTKCETQDGAFSRSSLRHRKGDGYTPRKARRSQNKRIRRKMKKEVSEEYYYT